MPPIPRFQSERTLGVPSISPEGVSAVSRATAGVGATVAETGLQAAEMFQQQAQREFAAERTLRALETDRDLQSDISEFTEGFQGRRDYENFESDTQEHLQGLRSKYLEQIGDDKELQIAFERRFNQSATSLTNVAKAKKLTVMTNRAIGAFETGFNASMQQYAEETDPTLREIIKGDIELGAAQLVANGFITEAQAEAKIKSFNDKAEALRADQMNMVDPEATENAILAGEFPDLDPTVRQQKLEDSILRQRQAIERSEQEEKKAATARKLRQEDTAVTWTANLAETGTADMVALREDLRAGNITREFYNSFVDDVRDVQSGARDVSDQTEILLVEEHIKAGTITRNEILHNRSITPEDRGTLLDKLDAFQDEQLKLNYEQGEDRLKSRIITTSPFMPPAAGEAERFSTAKAELYERLKGGESLDVVLKDMVPRYDTRPDKLNALPKPRFSNKPASIAEVTAAKTTLLEKFSNGTININTPEGQRAAERELDLLNSYQTIYERMDADAR